MIFVLLILSVLISLVQSQCSAPTPYRLAANNTCYAVCPWSPPNLYYASPFDNTCQTLCPSGWFGFDGNKTCTQTCPTTPNMTFYDSTNRKCVVSCPTGSFSYIGTVTASNQKCVATCPAGTFAQQLNRQCVASCPSNTFYKNDSTPFCVVRCPDNHYASPLDKNCKVGSTCPATPVMHFADDTTNMCVQSCPANNFADITTKRCLKFCSATYFSDPTTWRCVQSCPPNYYRSNVTKSCLLVCTQGFFIDRLTGNCTQTCSAGTFGDFATGFCEEECTFPTFSDTVVGRCVNTCSFGLFANNFTSSCVTAINCHANLIGDPTTRRCLQPSTCPTAPYHYANLVAKACTPKCPPPLWGDKSTKTCVSNCPWNPATYVSWKNPDTQQCVTKCPEFPILYADNSTQTCVATCPGVAGTVLYDTFADDISQQCVRVCPNGFKSQKPQFICISDCSNIPVTLYFYHANSSCLTGCPQGYYADPSKQVCAEVCPSNPDLFALEVDNTCVPECPPNTYADSSTRKCAQWCPQTTLKYADNSTNECVQVCPTTPDYYGLDRIDGNKVCVLTCDVGLFADPLTRTCLPACDIQEGYYGELTNPVRKCILQCNPNFFADNFTKTCVSKCPDFPSKFFGNPFTKKCEKLCPQFLYGNSATNVCGLPTACETGFFADDLSNKCVRICPASERTYGQSTSRRCLKQCPQGRFADDTTRRCQINCNATAKLFKDASTNRCVQNCPSRPNLYNNPKTMSCDERCTEGFFAYDGTRRCVAMCPSTPAFFGNIDTFRCVDECPAQRYKFATNTQRTCRSSCPVSHLGDTYGDNTTWSCVTVCPKSEDLYSFKHPTVATIRTCVKTCPVLNTNTLFYFADNVTQSCVTLCPLRRLSWGDKFTLKCERNCTRNQYRDNITTQCTYECSYPRFADNTTWDCVEKCPNGTYAYELGTNRTCLRSCPTGLYADNTTNFCRHCDHDITLWSDNTTWKCVKTCPTIPDLYADPSTDRCEQYCYGGLFADKLQRKCVPALSCSPGTIGEPYTARCMTRCRIDVPNFWQVSLNQCVPQCPPGFYADNSTMKCEQTCSSTPDYYAFNDTTLGPICVLYCPATYYRHLPNRTCLTACPAPDYFRDPTTMRCVQVCPDHYFAETIGQVCVMNCSVNSKYGLNNLCSTGCTGQYNADPTTFLCVKKCPFTYFSQNNICKLNCATGYADPITKICEPTICSLGYYVQTGTKKCVRECGTDYKYDANQTCLSTCPKTSDHSTNLYKDNNTYMCVNRCQPGWYADNVTGFCNTQCSANLWADNSTGRCVSKCPSTPDFFGYLRVCQFPCPKVDANTFLFAENTSRQCLLLCPNGSYADKYNRRCMDVCTLKQYAYTNIVSSVVHNLCVEMCPQGLYASDKSKSCVPLCDLGTYGENVTNKCLKTCPTATYADDFLRLCVDDCSVGRMEFEDWSTQRCVKNCPSVPSLYAQNSSRSCVAACVTGWFGLNTTRVCTQNCPQPYYADPTTGYCELKCHFGTTNRFADNVTRSCVVNCPNYTDPVTNAEVITYEDNSTKTCVKQCPFFPSLYGFNETNACVEDCPTGTFGDNDTRLCLEKCFWNVTFNGQRKFTWADSATKFCTNDCSRGSFADNRTVTCVANCSEGTFSENSTRRCVFNCPVNPVSFAKRQTRQCVQRCDVGFFGDELSRRCVETCPQQPYYYYMDYLNQRCVKNCTPTATTQYFAEDLSQSCVTDCTIGYFKSLSRKACVKCPSSCLVCYAELSCTSCQPSLFLHDGSCIESCPSFPIRYYANVLSSKCVKDCPSPYFGFNGTGKCQLTCPQKYFSDITDNSCKLCNTGCRQCITQTNCTSCLNGYVYVPQYNTCSKVCNITHTYYVDSKCQFSCIDGTFLLSDLVTCQKCSTACATCSMSGTNCTKCNNRFWYNFNCVTGCPTGFYADSNNSCIDCKINAAACSVQTLRYDVQPFTKDYKIFAFVKFNRPISLGKSAALRSVNSISTRVSSASQPHNGSSASRAVGTSDRMIKVGEDAPSSEEQDFSTLMIIKTTKGPLKASSYRATKYNESVFLVEFYEATSLNEMALSVDFVPGSIVDSYGNGLAESTKTIQFATLETVSLQVKQAAVQMKQNVNVLGWILVAVLGLMMLKISYPLLVLIDFLQLIYMHLYVDVSPLPYFWMNIMSSMENVNFVFLPQFHSEIDETSTNPYNYFKKDITMLGNIQPLVYIGGLFGAIYLIFWGLSVCKIKVFRCLRKRVKRIFKDRMRFSLLNEIFYYTQLQVFFFAVLQWPANRSVQKTAANLAASIGVFIVYVAWLVFLLYKSSHYSKSLDSMPKRYKFLVLEPSQFPLDMALRYMLKLLFCLCLLLPQKSIQLIFLMTMNAVYFFYNLIYKPSVSKMTNYMNMFVTAGFMAYEICLFAYGLTNKGAIIQQQFSLILLAIPGVVLVGIVAWILFRCFMFIKVDLLKIGLSNKEAMEMVYQGQEDYEKDKEIEEYQSTKNQNVFSFFNMNKLQSTKLSVLPKSEYKKISSHHEKSMLNDDDEEKSGKNMLPELQFNQEDEEDSEPEINEEEIMNEFAYHMVPKKNEALIQAEKKVMEKNQERLGGSANIRKKKLKGSSIPLVIAINEDELIDKNIEIIDKSKEGKLQEPKELKETKRPRAIKSSKLKRQKKPSRLGTQSVIFNAEHDSDNVISVVSSEVDLQE